MDDTEFEIVINISANIYWQDSPKNFAEECFREHAQIKLQSRARKMSNNKKIVNAIIDALINNYSEIKTELLIDNPLNQKN